MEQEVVDNDNIFLQSIKSFTHALDILGADSNQTIVINEGSMKLLDSLILKGVPNSISAKLKDVNPLVHTLKINEYLLHFVSKKNK